MAGRTFVSSAFVQAFVASRSNSLGPSAFRDDGTARSNVTQIFESLPAVTNELVGIALHAVDDSSIIKAQMWQKVRIEPVVREERKDERRNEKPSGSSAMPKGLHIPFLAQSC